ncbi:MAG: glycosyltransferase [Gemmatimonadaceae bacterium]
MRLVWMKAGKLLPVDTGGKIRSYHIFRNLAQRHDATLLSYYIGPRDVAYERALTDQFPGAVCVPIRSGGALGEALHFASRLPRSAPYAVAKHADPHVRDALARVIAERNPDVIVCDFLAASMNMAGVHGLPTVLFQHNVESALWRRQAKHERHPAKRALFRVEAAKMARYERRALDRFDRIVAVSEHDKSLMTAMSPHSKITVVPTGVDVAHFRRPSMDASSAPTVMFLGSMDWPANADGVEYFCADIWPRIAAAVPGARFQVVGRNPSARVQALASDSVEIVGGVTSVLPHLHAASVFVVPLRIGGGTRLKIYEAMAAGLPIVSTSVGAEGLDFTDGRDIVIADDADAFVRATVDLLRDPVRRAAVSAAAVQTAELFDWSQISLAFDALLERTCDEHAGSDTVLT